jgi:hypothetical protein
MGLYTYKISEFDHSAETKQFDSIISFLRQKFNKDDCYLIGNYNIEGVELDALLICESFIKVLEFKNWGGHIIARENGSWSADSLIIAGGSGRKSPYEQIRLNRSRVHTGLCSMLNANLGNIGAVIIFSKCSTIDDTQLSDNVKAWLSVCDKDHLDEILKPIKSGNSSKNMVKELIGKMQIAEFAYQYESQGPMLEESSLFFETSGESSTNFYEELLASLKFAPDNKKIYNSFNQVFTKAINQKTNFVNTTLVGPFAKTDYLLKEYHATYKLNKAVNDVRAHLRKRYELDVAMLGESYLYDFKSLCQFIELIYNEPIPDECSKLFPPDRVEKKQPVLVSECMRIVIDKWDDKFFYGVTSDENSEQVKVCYATCNKPYDYDWSYLKNMFDVGSQVNIIRPREEEDILYPELIILHPDYLVDITSVANCFENYNVSPYIHLLNKIRPNPISEAIVLGNFAGQLLDEEVQQIDTSYNASITKFFKHNALSLLAAGVGSNFHSEAQIQKVNIHNAISVDLPQQVKSFSINDIVVEPTFFSEMLGLQGRMDFLQLDKKVVIEQKSGKCGWPQRDSNIPVQLEKHYIQMLLYMLLLRYNYRGQYEGNRRELYAYLLYSKYRKPLLGLSFSPELIFKAIKIRNEIAWSEIIYSNGCFKILDELSADKLNAKGLSSKLWDMYQKPQIEKLLDPIHTSSNLERSYYYRFQTFISKEQLLSKLGDKKADSGFAATWLESLEDKHFAGNIYDNLKLKSPINNGSGRVERVEFSFDENINNDMANFRIGDAVILYSYSKGEEPDVRKSMVYRCFIVNIETDEITLQLNVAQSDARVFIHYKESLWAIEHDYRDSSYASLYRGMHAFLSAPKERRDLLMFQRRPVVDSSAKLSGKYGKSEYNELVKRAKQAKDLFLIIGPPGTGKTSRGLLYTLEEELSNPTSSVLLLAYTNRAVDEICEKLTENDIEFIRLGNELSCSQKFRDNLLSSKLCSCQNISQVSQVIRGNRVMVGTTASVNSDVALFKLKTFDLAIVDEASQILEPHIMGVLSAVDDKGDSSVKKIILIGDHKQLPAVVLQDKESSKVLDPALKDIMLTDCRLSLFERMLKKYGKDDSVTYMLTKQGRMHHDIAVFPNYAFYKNSLLEVPTEEQEKVLPLHYTGNNGIANILSTRRLVFLSVHVSQKSNADSSADKINKDEATVIAATVFQIYQLNKGRFVDRETIGVIVPYRNQIIAVRNILDTYGIKELHDITIDTVERFQGSQRDYIIYGFTIKKYYQLKFLTANVFTDEGSVIDRKLNVAMTRAKKHLILVGDPNLLNNNFTFFKLIEFIKGKQGYFEILVDVYKSGKFNVPDINVGDVDLSQAVYSVSEAYNSAYEDKILLPLKKLSGTSWPTLVMGRQMNMNLNLIGYGRINFKEVIGLNHGENLPPKEQVLLYCYYIMRMHYCSSKVIFSSYEKWFRNIIVGHEGRLHFIDIGCGPATCGIAFSEIFKEDARGMLYTGIDVSEEMQKKGLSFMSSIFGDKLKVEMLDSFEKLDIEFWDVYSELPTCFIFNFSYFFSNVSAQFTEAMANRMNMIMKKYPLNKYIFVIQHSECDTELNSFKVFRSLIRNNVKIVKSEKTCFKYKLSLAPRSCDFCYEILESK